MRRLCLILFALVISLPAYSQARHPFTFEDMMKLKRVGEPVPSPDGKWVLFSVVDVDLEKNTRTPHVWIVPLGSQTQGPSTALGMTNSVGTGVSPVQAERSSAGVSSASERILIPDQDGDRPRWAPDGKRFAFISTKEGGSQVWIADFDGASGTVTGTHKLTSIATEASGELWLPDGKDILFVSDVYPECDGAPAEEQECNAKKLKEREESKVKALIFDHLLYRHWNAYREGKRTHIFVVAADARVGADVSSAQSSAARQESSSASPSRAGEDILRQAQDRLRPYTNIPRDLTPGDYDSPVFSLGGQDNYAFSPDGQEICYTSNHDPVPAISTNNDLWIVPLNVGTAASAVRSGEAGPNSVELRSTRQPGAAVATQSQSGYVSEVVAQTRNITADNPASDSTPLYSPDGKYIAYRAQKRPGYESDRFRLMLYDRKTGEKKGVTENYDGWAESFTWLPNSRGLLFTTEQEGGSPLFWVLPFDPKASSGAGPVIRDKELILVAARGFFDSPVALTTDLIVADGMSLESPNEIYAMHLSSLRLGGAPPESRAAQLTHFNDPVLSQVAMSPLESFWFTGALGDKVQGFLVKPPNFDPSKKYPVKFLIHGGPQGAWGDDWSYRWNPELFAANGYVVIMINFHGSTGYGQKFIDAINGDWGGAPFEDLMKGLDYAEQHYPFIDKDRECALGASYGGYMVNWILGHTNRFKCLVSHDGMFNATSAWGTTEELWFNEWEFKGTPYTNREMYRKWSPHLSATSFKTPTLVIHGQRDYRLDVSEGFQLFTTLQRLGVPSKMLYFPDEGHWVLKPQNSQLWYKTVNDWVDQWLKK